MHNHDIDHKKKLDKCRETKIKPHLKAENGSENCILPDCKNSKSESPKSMPITASGKKHKLVSILGIALTSSLTLTAGLRSGVYLWHVWQKMKYYSVAQEQHRGACIVFEDAAERGAER